MCNLSEARFYFEESNIFLGFGYMHISEPPQKWLCCPLFKKKNAINKYYTATQQASGATFGYSLNLAPVARYGTYSTNSTIFSMTVTNES